MAKFIRCRHCRREIRGSKLRCVKCGVWVSSLAEMLTDTAGLELGPAIKARTWSTLDKRHLVVCEMETPHLTHTIKYMARACWDIRGKFVEKVQRWGNTPAEVNTVMSAANKSTWEDFLPARAYVMLAELAIREPPFTLKDLRDYMNEELGCDWTGGAFS